MNSSNTVNILKPCMILFGLHFYLLGIGKIYYHAIHGQILEILLTGDDVKRIFLWVIVKLA